MPSSHRQDSRRAEPRIPVKEINSVIFSVKAGDEVLDIPVANLSTKGLGFVNKYSFEIPKGTILRGDLIFSGDRVPIVVEVVFSSQTNIGCIITTNPSEYMEKLNRFFMSELTALKLRPVEGQYKCEEGETLTYFEGENNCYVLVIKAGDSLKRFKVSYFGNVFEGGDKKMFTACQIVEDTEFNNFSKGGAIEMLKPITSMHSDFKKSVLKYIDALEFLSDLDRQKVLKLVQDKVPTD